MSISLHIHLSCSFRDFNLKHEIIEFRMVKYWQNFIHPLLKTNNLDLFLHAYIQCTSIILKLLANLQQLKIKLTNYQVYNKYCS